jgi:dCTP deaminase
MAVLTRKDILEAIRKGELAFEPGLDRFQLQPHAVDLRLGTVFRIPLAWKVTARGREALLVDYLSSKGETDAFETVKLEFGQFFEILPGEFVIASTLEKISVSTRLTATLYPRSSLNRKGLAVDLSGVIDAGYQGKLIIPLVNKTQRQVVRLYPGERVCQITLLDLTGEADAYSGKYLNFRGKGGAKPELEEERELIRSGDLRGLKEKFEVG